MGHSIQNIDISKPLTHTMPYTLSTICTVQWQPWFIREENTSPKFQTPSNVSICPVKSVTTTKCTQVETTIRTMSMQMRFPEMVSDCLCRNYLVMQTDCCSSRPGGWSQTILEVKMLDEEVLGWCGYMWSAAVMPVGCTVKILWNAFGESLWQRNEHSIHGQQLCWTFLQSAGQLHAPSKLATSVALCCVHILEWPAQGTSVQLSCCLIGNLICHTCEVDGLSRQRICTH